MSWEEKRYRTTLQSAQERLLQDMKPVERVMMKPNVFGQTPLYLAKQAGDEQAMTMLMENIKKIYEIDVMNHPGKNQGIANASTEENEERNSTEGNKFIKSIETIMQYFFPLISYDLSSFSHVISRTNAGRIHR
jgi:hypothetical protein